MNVRTLCLAILNFGEATGYEIRKKTQEGVFSYFINASYGSIYPALTQLTKDGLVSCRSQMQSGKPNKKIYTLTERGRQAFIEALQSSPGEDIFKSEFLMIMMCSDLVAPDRISELIDERLEWLDNKIAYLRGVIEEVESDGIHFAVGCGISAYESAARHLRENRYRIERSAGKALAGGPRPAPTSEGETPCE